MTRVLLVDDEPELLEAWSFALKYAGYQVECAHDGREALDLVRQRPPDLLITDLMMPGMNGEDLCRSMRANPDWSQIPIILHTSAHVAALGAPALWDSVLRKPAHMDAFLATVEKLTEG
jgi:DNA-binding response OmpR family regulator